ncbi:dUTP diphosphatase [Dankookia sp. GCM10030260]|uniref:dUTP diphosphatase n=1 Tax=Dankookia sp. GCM10030260 TaxID=3273390 RepID=UPI00361E9E96
MPSIELKILDARLRDWGLPRYQTAMAAAIDLLACLDAPVEIAPGSAPVLISSGIAIHIGDPGLAAVVLPRSGLGHKQGLVLGNLVGLIDADYTGPIMVSAWNRNAAGTPPIRLSPGDRFAQLAFVPIVRPDFAVVDEFTAPSGRGAGGFGSTGR